MPEYQKIMDRSFAFFEKLLHVADKKPVKTYTCPSCGTRYIIAKKAKQCCKA